MTTQNRKNLEKILTKALKIIRSCTNLTHIEGAEKYCELASSYLNNFMKIRQEERAEILEFLFKVISIRKDKIK